MLGIIIKGGLETLNLTIKSTGLALQLTIKELLQYLLKYN